MYKQVNYLISNKIMKLSYTVFMVECLSFSSLKIFLGDLNIFLFTDKFAINLLVE